jgi:hypothetical protein
MNPEIKAEWLKALRSGDYEQAEDALRNDSGFCCLGVLCDLHAKKTGVLWDGFVYLGVADVLPHTVQEWADLPAREGGSVIIHEDEEYLTELNDNGVSFAVLADLIEQQL